MSQDTKSCHFVPMFVGCKMCFTCRDVVFVFELSIRHEWVDTIGMLIDDESDSTCSNTTTYSSREEQRIQLQLQLDKVHTRKESSCGVYPYISSSIFSTGPIEVVRSSPRRENLNHISNLINTHFVVRITRTTQQNTLYLYELTHSQTYNHSNTNTKIQVLNSRATSVGPVEKIELDM